MRISSLLVVALLATSAHGASIQVAPGPGTPLQDTIGAASPGDKLILGAGSYYETVVVDKRVKIIADGPVTIGPEQGALQSSCSPAFVLDIRADGVRIQGGKGVNDNMIVQGGGTGAIGIFGFGSSLTKMRKGDGLTFCPGASALHLQSVSRVKIQRGTFTNYSLSLTQRAPACRIADVYGRVDLRSVVCRAAINPVGGTEAGAGLLIENIPAISTPLIVNITGGVFITSGGDAPVALRDARLVLIRKVYLLGAPLILGEPIYASITLDAASSDNLVQDSTLQGPILDDGTGNCFRHNVDQDSMPLPDQCS